MIKPKMPFPLVSRDIRKVEMTRWKVILKVFSPDRNRKQNRKIKMTQIRFRSGWIITTENRFFYEIFYKNSLFLVCFRYSVIGGF